MATLIPNPDNTPGAASTGYGYQNTQIYAMRVGHIMLGLTNIDSTSASQIAAGSVVEVNGAFFKCSANENITGTPVALKKNYIYAVPSASGATFQFLSGAPEPSWNTAKGGWYNGNNRAVARVFYMNGLYYDKIVLDTYSAGASASTSQPIPDSGGTIVAWYGSGAVPGTPAYPYSTSPGNYTLNAEPGGYRVEMRGAMGGTGGDGGKGGNGNTNLPSNAGYGADGDEGDPPLPSSADSLPITIAKFVLTEKTAIPIEVGATGATGEDGKDGKNGVSIVSGEDTYYSAGGGAGGGGSGADGGFTCIHGPTTVIATSGRGGNGGNGGKGGDGGSTSQPAANRPKGGDGGARGRCHVNTTTQEDGEGGDDGFNGENYGSETSQATYAIGGKGGRRGRGGRYKSISITDARVKIYKAW
jgi:hypothetical protein